MISKAEARSVLSPHHGDLFLCVSNAWECWKAKIAPLFPAPSRRCRANMVYELMADQALSRFGASHEVVVLEHTQQVLLQFEGKLIVRFKKLGREMLTSNYPTQHALLFDGQRWLPDVPLQNRVTVGYRLNEITQDDPEVLVVFTVGRAVRWHYAIPAVETASIHPFERDGERTSESNRLARRKGENADSGKEEAES